MILECFGGSCQMFIADAGNDRIQVFEIAGFN
jgi:hypothetical protein